MKREGPSSASDEEDTRIAKKGRYDAYSTSGSESESDIEELFMPNMQSLQIKWNAFREEQLGLSPQLAPAPVMPYWADNANILNSTDEEDIVPEFCSDFVQLRFK